MREGADGGGGGFRFVHRVDVRFHDIDIGGHAHHAQALVYFEEARTGYWSRVAGRDDPAEVDYILAEARIRYHERILYPQRLDVGVRVSVLGKKHLEMEYEVTAPDGTRLASGATVLVMFDYGRGRPARVTDELRERIEAHEGRELPRRRA